MFKREIRNYAKTNKPNLSHILYWSQNFYYLYNKANLDSVLNITDSLYVIIKYNQGYTTDFSIQLFANEWEYYLWLNTFSESLKKCFDSNFNNDPLLLFLLKRKDLIYFSEADKYFVTKGSRNSILMLCTKDLKGKLKREIICN